MKYRVLEDCFCEHYLHEINNYPRPGLVELKLYKGEEVIYVREFSNFYGDYIRVKKEDSDQVYDIPPYKLEVVK